MIDHTVHYVFHCPISICEDNICMMELCNVYNWFNKPERENKLFNSFNLSVVSKKSILIG